MRAGKLDFGFSSYIRDFLQFMCLVDDEWDALRSPMWLHTPK
jgi:hypothetical protein